MQIFLSFIPWILYFTLVGFGYFEIAPIAAFIAASLFGFKGLRHKFLVEWITLIFFFLLSVLYLFPIRQELNTYAPLIANFLLPLIMWFTVLIGRPFTSQYSRDLSEDKKKTKAFRSIHYALSIGWALGLSLMPIMSLLQFLHKVDSPVLVQILSFSGIAAAWIFSQIFPILYKKMHHK